MRNIYLRKGLVYAIFQTINWTGLHPTILLWIPNFIMKTWKVIHMKKRKIMRNPKSRNKFLIRIERVWGSISFNDVVTNLKYHVGPFRHHFACYDSFFGHVRCHKRSTLGLLLCFELQNRAAVVHIVKMAENNLRLTKK